MTVKCAPGSTTDEENREPGTVTYDTTVLQIGPVLTQMLQKGLPNAAINGVMVQSGVTTQQVHKHFMISTSR